MKLPARWRAYRRLRITRMGRAYLLVTVGVGIGALNTGNNLLFLVLGLMLAIVVLSGVLSERVVRDLEVRRLLPEGAFAGDTFRVRFEVAKTKDRGFALQIVDEVLGASAFLPQVHGSAMVSAVAKAPARGPLALSRVRVSTLFPFGLFEKIRDMDVPQVFTIWPRPQQFPVEILEGIPATVDGRTRMRNGDGDLAGLRDLAALEDARRVHWKKSASALKLLSVERDREDRSQFVIVLPAALLGSQLELACSGAALVTIQLLGRGADVGLMASGTHIRPSHGRAHQGRLLTALAYVGCTQ